MPNQEIKHQHQEGTLVDYLLFASVLVGVLLVSMLITMIRHLDATEFMRIFMAVFFLVFAIFKLLDLRGFVSSFIGYDLVAKKYIHYAYAYPFIELFLSLGYFLNWPFINFLTIVILTIGGVGVTQQLLRGSQVRCACLGIYIKLPLTTVSLVEDVMMVAMALVLIFVKV